MENRIAEAWKELMMDDRDGTTIAFAETLLEIAMDSAVVLGEANDDCVIFTENGVRYTPEKDARGSSLSKQDFVKSARGWQLFYGTRQTATRLCMVEKSSPSERDAVNQ